MKIKKRFLEQYYFRRELTMIQENRKSYYFVSIPTWVTGVLFLILFLILSLHSRLASDDFYYLYLTKNFGAWQGMIYQYNQWSGRWTAHFLACFFLEYYQNPFLLPFILWFSLITLFLCIRLSIKRLFLYFFRDGSEKHASELSLVLLISFYFCTYNINETWFWYIIIITYLWSLIASLLLLNVIFSSSGIFIKLPLLILLAAYIGGASESFAIINLLILSATGFYLWKYSENKSKDHSFRLILLSIVLISISLLFSALAPGTAVRYSMLPHPPITEKIWVAIKAIVKFFVRYLPGKLLYLCMFSFPWFLAGTIAGNKYFDRIRFRLLFNNLTIIFLVLIAVMFFPTAIIMSETGPDRALSIISLTTAAYFAFAFFLLGTQTKIKNNFMRYFGAGYAASIIIFFALLIPEQFKTTRKFAISYDQRIMLLLDYSKKDRREILEVPKLPFSGMLYWEELSEDTNYFVNKHLRAGLDLPFAVKCRKE